MPMVDMNSIQSNPNPRNMSNDLKFGIFPRFIYFFRVLCTFSAFYVPFPRFIYFFRVLSTFSAFYVPFPFVPVVLEKARAVLTV